MQCAIAAMIPRCAVISILLAAGAVGCAQETPQVSDSGMGVDDCRRLWQHTFWVENRLEAERPALDESLHAAVMQVSEQYDVPLHIFDSCWDSLKDAGYSPRDLESYAR